jgi:hypothetical protein
MSYRVRFSAYCGLSAPATRCEDRADARLHVAEYLRRARRSGLPVTTVEPGIQWEILEPAQAAMVPDDCGLLTLSHDTFECRECGCEYETPECAGQCCAFIEDDCFTFDMEDAA